MYINQFRVSKHARRRMAQRNLTSDDIALVLRSGRRIYRAGARFFFLGFRDLPPGTEPKIKRLVGTTIVTADEEIITVYRNRNALSDIKRKLKRFIPARREVSRASLKQQLQLSKFQRY